MDAASSGTTLIYPDMEHINVKYMTNAIELAVKVEI
jgi:hypothetical protein